ncbi:MAG: hypothetical protein V1750_08725, partial [Acidobacteriota bacterium]
MAFVVGRARTDLESNRQLVLALVKCIEIVGVASQPRSLLSSPACRRIASSVPFGMSLRWN